MFWKEGANGPYIAFEVFIIHHEKHFTNVQLYCTSKTLDVQREMIHIHSWLNKETESNYFLIA